MNKALFAVLIFSLCLTPVFAAVELSARPMGMGGAFVGVADDVNSIFANPAGVASVRKEAVLVSTRLVEGQELTMIGGVEHTPFGSLGVGYVGASEQESVADKATTQTLYLTLAQDLNRKMKMPKGMGDLSLGLNLKFSSRKAALANGQTADRGSNVDLDVATVFKPSDRLTFGLSLQNAMNGKTGAEAATGEAVSTLQAGVSGKLLDDSLTWSLQENTQGCEWRPAKGLSLRLGRGDGYFTSGFGLNLNGFSVDYAYAGGTDPVHYWSVSIAPPDDQPVAAAGSDQPVQPEGKSASVMPDAYEF